MLEFTASRHQCDACGRKGPGYMTLHRETPVLFHCSTCVNWQYRAEVVKAAQEAAREVGHTRGGHLR